MMTNYPIEWNRELWEMDLKLFIFRMTLWQHLGSIFNPTFRQCNWMAKELVFFLRGVLYKHWRTFTQSLVKCLDRRKMLMVFPALGTLYYLLSTLLSERPIPKEEVKVQQVRHAVKTLIPHISAAVVLLNSLFELHEAWCDKHLEDKTICA